MPHARQRLFGARTPDGSSYRVSSISLSARNAEDLEAIQSRVTALLRQRHHLKADGSTDDFSIFNQDDTLRGRSSVTLVRNEWFTVVQGVAEATAALRTFIEAAGGRVAVELESMNAGLASALSGREPKNITPVIQEMIRVKDPDEIECIRATIAMTEAGYAAIKARLEPGLTELQAYKIVYEAMADHAGTSVDLKGDFACGTRAIKEGGAPTDRRVQAGDLFILDLFPAYNGYLCDLCRTFAASPATQLQHDAWAHIMEAHRIAERILRPGAFARDVYRELRAHLDGFEAAKGSFWHHAGHGVGLNEWEFPWLTPGSDHVIRQGEVVACEPGLYSEELQGGIRLEHNYLVGADEAVALDQFPMGL